MKATKVKSYCKRKKPETGHPEPSESGCIKYKVSKAQKGAQVLSQSDDSDDEIEVTDSEKCLQKCV